MHFAKTVLEGPLCDSQPLRPCSFQVALISVVYNSPLGTKPSQDG